MPSLTTTLNKIKSHNPCTGGWYWLLTGLKKNKSDNRPLKLERIFKINGLKDALWALQTIDEYQSPIQLYYCFCAKYVLPIFEKQYPEDKRPRKAIEVAERFARGEVRHKELVIAAATAAVAIGDACRVADYAAADAARAALSAATYPFCFTAYVPPFVPVNGTKTPAEYAIDAIANSTNTEGTWKLFKEEFIKLCRLEGAYAL